MDNATMDNAMMDGETMDGATAGAQPLGKNRKRVMTQEENMRHGNNRRRTRRYPLLRRAWLPPYPAEAAPS